MSQRRKREWDKRERKRVRDREGKWATEIALARTRVIEREIYANHVQTICIKSFCSLQLKNS